MSPSCVRVSIGGMPPGCQPRFVNEPQPARAFGDEDIAAGQERQGSRLVERVGDGDDAHAGRSVGITDGSGTR
ncbi:MAG TPA: hypothetical protein VKE51_25290 [Vicinamibacterales bacterium]|nr:hypothetical protein [Vicinamibacterales bacterium]